MVLHPAALAARLALLKGGFPLYYTDYHCHSILSMDGKVPLSVMAEHMAAAGMNEICLTDHFDLLDGDAKRCYASDMDWEAAVKQYRETLPLFEGRLTIKLGLEYGMGYIEPPESRKVLDQPLLDFVIGSVHNLSPERGGTDLYLVDYSTEEACHLALQDYFDSMEKLVRSDFYDSLGHIIYPLRYMGGKVSILSYLDRVEVLLKVLLDKGKAMEVNTCRGRTVEDWRPILRLYRSMGGELLTVGSDAHHPEQAAFGVKEAYEMIRESGFRYICTYDKRKANFIQI